MRGNFSTEGHYETTQKERPLSQLTLNLRRQSSLTRPSHNGFDTHAFVTPKAQAQAPRSSIPACPRPKKAKTTVKNGSRRVSRARAYSVGTQPSPARSGRSASSLNAPTIETLRSQPPDESLWIRPHKVAIDAEPVVTHYDSSCNSSLISKTAALRLGLRPLPCTPNLCLAIMTDFGVFQPEEFVKVDVEATWLKDSELGECNVTVVSGNILESKGIEFLAGKRILEKLRLKNSLSEKTQAQIDLGFNRGADRPRTMPSMADGSDWERALLENGQLCGASDYLHPGMGTRSPYVPSYISASVEPSFSSANDAAPDSTTWTSILDAQSLPYEDDSCSLNQVFYDDDCNSFNSMGDQNQSSNFSLPGDVNGPPFQSVYSQGAIQTTLQMGVPQPTAASPTMSYDSVGFADSCTPIPSSQILEAQMASQGYSFMSQVSQSLYNPAVVSNSEENDRSISEDSPEEQQGMTRWTCRPSYPSFSMMLAPSPMFATFLPEIRVETASNGTGAQRNSSPPDSTTNDDPNSFL